MLLVGLTGGIGSGKSTVAAMLAERGAVVLDADRLARDAIAPGTPGARAVAERFGDRVVGPDGALDRRALAAIVFADADARAALEAIVHPAVRVATAEVVAARADTDDVVVIDSPLLVETGGHEDLPVLVVVTATVDTRLERLASRGLSVTDARARMDAQMPLDEKAELADFVLDNEGTRAALEGQVERLWADLQARALSSPA